MSRTGTGVTSDNNSTSDRDPRREIPATMQSSTVVWSMRRMSMPIWTCVVVLTSRVPWFGVFALNGAEYRHQTNSKSSLKAPFAVSRIRQAPPRVHIRSHPQGAQLSCGAGSTGKGTKGVRSASPLILHIRACQRCSDRCSLHVFRSPSLRWWCGAVPYATSGCAQLVCVV